VAIISETADRNKFGSQYQHVFEGAIHVFT